VNPDYVQGRGQWARPEHKGYTMDWKEAGRFAETEAKEVEARAGGKYTAIPIQPNAPGESRGIPRTLDPIVGLPTQGGVKI